MVRARLVPGEHNDIWEPVNGDEWLKWSGALARSPLGVSNQQLHFRWLLVLWAQRHNGASPQIQMADLQKMTFISTVCVCVSILE